MAIYFETKTPNKLRNAFKKAIDDGHVVTWSYDEDGDFTHTTEQWVKKSLAAPGCYERYASIVFHHTP